MGDFLKIESGGGVRGGLWLFRGHVFDENGRVEDEAPTPSQGYFLFLFHFKIQKGITKSCIMVGWDDRHTLGSPSLGMT